MAWATKPNEKIEKFGDSIGVLFLIQF